jgi:tetratricopeptide (TPR) repeat protein
MYWYYYDRSEERLAKGKVTAERAVELQPELSEAHAALGWYLYQGLLDYPRALSEFALASKIKPSNTDALLGTGAVLRRQGKWAEAADAMSKAVEFDPKNADLLGNFGATCGLARRYTEADRAYGLANALSRQSAEAYAWRALLQIQWRGDVGKAQSVLDEAAQVVGLHDDQRALARSALRIALARRDYHGALRQLDAETQPAIDNQWVYEPIPVLRGKVAMLADQRDLAQRSFEAARLELAQKVLQDPNDARFHGSLAIAYAGLGRRDDAVREARLGCNLMPVTKDALRALWRLEDLALVYTWVGRHGEAISVLDDLLGRSGNWTPHMLRLDPAWDPLRSDPRFQALLVKCEVKD